MMTDEMREYRCNECKRLLMRAKGTPGNLRIEIKCKCTYIAIFRFGKEKLKAVHNQQSSLVTA